MNADESSYIKKLKEKLKEKPDSRLFLSLAEELLKREDVDEAISVLEDGIKKNPDLINARLSLGKCYLAKDMLEEAKNEFLSVIEKSPGNALARRYLNEVKKKLAGSEDVKAITRSPAVLGSKEMAQLYEAEKFVAEGQYKKAIEIYTGMLSSNMKKVRVLPGTEEVKKHAGKDTERVINHLNRFVEAIKNRFARESLHES